MTNPQENFDAFVNKDLEFSDLQETLVTMISDDPGARWEVMRLVDEHFKSGHLSQDFHRTLKEAIETHLYETPEDPTLVLHDSEADNPELYEHADDTVPKPFEGNDVRVATSPFGIDSSLAVEWLKDIESRSVTASVSLGETLLPGHILKGRFVLDEPLGRGGMGVVYRARDRLRQRANVGSPFVAIKVLREEYRQNPESLVALQREAYQAQFLSHPNIVNVFDFDRDDDTYFLTMELLEGELLRSLFSRNAPDTVDIDRARTIIKGMCRGLACAHESGIVHSDFKPGNVFLLHDGGTKILDFGIARAAVPVGKDTDTPRLAGAALRAITPAYASCEMLEGDTPDFRDDTYSLACVIYELLAGHHPFDKKSALVAREEELRPKRIKSLSDHQWQALSKGLAFDRAQRTVDAKTLEHELFSDVVVSVPAEQPTVHKPSEPKRSHLSTVVALAAGLVFGAGLLAVYQNYTKPADTGTTQATPPPTTNDVDPSVETATDTTLLVADTPMPDASIVAFETMNLESNGTPETLVVETAEVVPEMPPPETQTALVVDEVTTIAPAEEETPKFEEPAAIIENGFAFDGAEFSIRENGNALALAVTRQGSIDTSASVAWATYEGSALAHQDYASFDWSPIQFAAGETEKTIYVPIVSDSIAEPNETFHVTLSNPSPDMVLAQPATVTVTIVDDDV